MSWFDWTLLDRHADLHRFVKALVALRQRRDIVRGNERFSLNQLLDRATIEWHGVALGQPDWSQHSHSLAFTLRTLRSRFDLHVICNAYWEPLTFELPPAPDGGLNSWRRCIDTAMPAPDDAVPWSMAPAVTRGEYVVQPRSTVLLALALG